MADTPRVDKEDREMLMIQEALIRDSSEFMDRALDRLGGDTVCIPDHHPEILAIYPYWLYFKEIPTKDMKSRRVSQSRNAPVRAFVEKVKSDTNLQEFSCHVARYIYESTDSDPDGSGELLRKLIVDVYLQYRNFDWVDRNACGAEYLPHELLLHLAGGQFRPEADRRVDLIDA
ncbi:hypothetical protein BDW69DRAFT_188325 [Aspergillus filifer]